MNSIFGIPTSQLAAILAMLSILLLLAMGGLALRRRTLVRMGIRNAGRRPFRTAIIVAGLMLSTVVIATAFSTGDAMTLTIRSLITGSVGQVDEVVTSSQTDFTQLANRDISSLASGAGLPAVNGDYFPATQYTTLRDAVHGSHAIGALVPAILEQAPVAAGNEQLAHPNIGLLGLPTEQIAGLDDLRDEHNGNRPMAALGPTDVYINRAAADLLGSGPRQILHVYLPANTAPASAPPVANDVTVRAIVRNSTLAGPQPTVFFALDSLQQLRAVPGRINQIMVINRCNADIAACSGQATTELRKVLVDRTAADSIRQALDSNSGRSVLNGLASRRTGRGKDQVLDLERTVRSGTLSDHLIYLLGDPQIAGTLRATAGFLPSRDGRAGRSLRTLNRLTVIEVKRSALDEANDYGGILTSSFLVLGLFSIAASLLLVFLVFVMLAAERRGEMGIARAIGLRRSHLVQSFSFEGLVYDLASALLGVGAGVAVSGAIVLLVGKALTGYGIPVEGTIEPRSLVIAFCLGLLVTFATVLFSAWRASRLNIVEAIRGLSPPPELGDSLLATARMRVRSAAAGVSSMTAGSLRAGGRQLLSALAGAAVLGGMLVGRGIVPVAAGYPLLVLGQQRQQYLAFGAGVSLLVLGGALLLRWLLLLARVAGEAVDRTAYTLAGAGLVGFWAFPPPFWHGTHGRFAVSSIETFALSGVMMVLGVVWVAAYNIEGPLQLLLQAFRRGGAITAAVKMAVAYPLQHRFRTGMAVAMFSLVIFTMVLSAVLLTSAHDAYVRRERPPTGYDIAATAPEKAQLTDITGALATAPASSPGEFTGIGSSGHLSADVIDLSARTTGWRTMNVYLADVGLVRSIRPALSGRAAGYSSDAAVWDAMATMPGAAVIARSSLVASSATPANSSGLHASDTGFPIATLWLRDGDTAPVRLRVIGIADDRTVLPGGVLTLKTNVHTPSASTLVPTSFVFKTRPGRDPAQAALGLNLSFGLQGMQTNVVGEGLRNVQTVRTLLNYLLEGFIGMGLVSGMAALAVISTRAVVERRQEIGMLRAIGLRRRLVQFSFLMEVSFIALLGIGVGIALGILLARNVVIYLSGSFQELQLSVPWREIGLIGAIAYIAALATTLVATWQAGRIEPAEALRYE